MPEVREMEKPRQKTKKAKIDFLFLATILLLLAIGLTMVFSASAPSSSYKGDSLGVIKKQLMWTCAGFISMWFFSQFSYKKLEKYSRIIFFATLLLMYLTPVIGVSRGGATRWIGIGSATFQPSELMKFALVLYFANLLSKDNKGKVRKFKNLAFPYLFLIALVAFSLALQSHLSGLVVTAAAAMIMLLAGGMNLAHFFMFGAFGLCGIAALAIFEPYRLNRLLAFIDPFKYKKDIGWQIVQSLYAIGSGGLFGLGLGQSRQKYLYVPEPHNDYIFAIVCEELGFVRASLILLLFLFFVWRGINIALKTPDKFGCLLAFGIVSLIGLQVLINVGVVTSVLPSTGMQLPFFSAGGSSLVIIMGAMGVMLNISKHSKIEKI
ncbi:MAG: putative lipid II flippase FtsW [Clostridiaceae bacterium]|nr:putative lipid II flippase FtsW [Clostridiaceae bacterium]